MFYYILHHFICILSYLCCVELSACPFMVWNLSDPKDKFSFYVFITNNKVLLHLYIYIYMCIKNPG